MYASFELIKLSLVLITLKGVFKARPYLIWKVVLAMLMPMPCQLFKRQ